MLGNQMQHLVCNGAADGANQSEVDMLGRSGFYDAAQSYGGGDYLEASARAEPFQASAMSR